MYESIEQLMAEKSALEEERERLKQEVKKLQMKRDALEVAGIMLKKFGGIDLKTMNNREKTIVIDALKKISSCWFAENAGYIKEQLLLSA